MGTHNALMGSYGERAALQFLIDQGYRLAAHNVKYRCGELDLIVIAPDGSLVVVEVKTRSSLSFGGAESVTSKKLSRMRKAAAQWLLDSNGFYSSVRFDVVVVQPGPDGATFEHFIGVEHGAW